MTWSRALGVSGASKADGFLRVTSVKASKKLRGVTEETSYPGTWFYSWVPGRGSQIRNLRGAVSIAGGDQERREEAGSAPGGGGGVVSRKPAEKPHLPSVVSGPPAMAREAGRADLRAGQGRGHCDLGVGRPRSVVVGVVLRAWGEENGAEMPGRPLVWEVGGCRRTSGAGAWPDMSLSHSPVVTCP